MLARGARMDTDFPLPNALVLHGETRQERSGRRSAGEKRKNAKTRHRITQKTRLVFLQQKTRNLRKAQKSVRLRKVQKGARRRISERLRKAYHYLDMNRAKFRAKNLPASCGWRSKRTFTPYMYIYNPRGVLPSTPHQGMGQTRLLYNCPRARAFKLG